jgi:LmbE family N-acetylglucosaminyl deacetylase
MHHIFVAPHLDDAVLSCGELIYTFRERGDSVSVMTVFTNNPGKDEPLSPAAAQYHSQCFWGHDSMTGRKHEDMDAAKFLGYNCIHLDFYECLYRKDLNGDFIYTDMETFGFIDKENDAALISRLCEIMPQVLCYADYIYVPYGLAAHADHMLIRHVFDNIDAHAIPKDKIFFYEEIPYICDMKKDERQKVFAGTSLHPMLIPLTKEAWVAKNEAILCYKSQLHGLWENESERMAQLEEVSMQYTGDHSLRLWAYTQTPPACIKA